MSTVSALEQRKFKASDFVLYAFLAIAAAVCIFPILHTFAISLSDSAAANAGKVTVYPIGFNLESYQTIISDEQFIQAFWVSLKRVFWVVLLGFVVTVFLAFPLSRDTNRFYLRNVYMWVLVFVMMFNGGIIPFYMVMRQLDLLNQFPALVLPLLINVFNVILVVNFFRNLPREMDESASMDGAGPWRMLFQIYLPLAIPVLATITLFNIVNTWNEYLLGLIMVTKTDLVPLQTYIQQIVVRIDPTRIVNDASYASRISNKTLNAAKIMITMIPIMIAYPFLQRYFISGIMLGSVKE